MRELLRDQRRQHVSNGRGQVLGKSATLFGQICSACFPLGRSESFQIPVDKMKVVVGVLLKLVDCSLMEKQFVEVECQVGLKMLAMGQ